MMMDYSSLTHFGTQNAMYRKLSHYEEKNEEYYKKIVNTTNTLTLILAILIIIGWMVFVTTYSHLNQYNNFVLILIPFLLISQLYISFYQNLYKGRGKFKTLGLITTIDGIGHLICIPLAYKYGFNGLIFGQLIRLFITNSYYYIKIKADISFSFTLEKSIVKNLVIQGLPIFYLITVDLILKTIDRLVIIYFIDEKSFGLYSIGLIFSTPFLMVFNAINSVYFRQISLKHNQEPEKTFSYVLPIMTKIVTLSIFIMVITYFSIPFLIEFFLNEYYLAIESVQLFVIGMFFYGVSGLPGTIFLARGEEKIRANILLILIMFNGIASVIFINLGLHIKGVALSSMLTYILFYVITFVIVLNKYEKIFLLKLKYTLKFLIIPVFIVSIILFCG